MLELSEKWIAVVNPKSGSGKTGHLWERAKSLMAAQGVDFEIRVTERVLHAVELVRSAAEEGFRRFIAVGGDGTVNEVLGGIMAFVERSGRALEEFVLAAIPIGSGNDWVRSHNVPMDVDGTVELLAAGSFALQDVFKAEAGSAASAGSEVRSGESEAVASAVRYMANIGGIGYDSNICDTVNGWKEEGRRGSLYVKSLIYNFLRYKGTAVEVECDGEVVHSGATFTIAFGNGRYCGGGLVQVPEARFDDGLIDVTIVPSYSKLRILSVLPKFFAGRILEIRGVIARKARSIVVRPLGLGALHGSASAQGPALPSRRSLPDIPEVIEIDGEILGRLPLRLSVCPGRLRVLHKF
ncbi:MAG: diacylglycerol kinase family lipid kinase [Bacteroidales bacterium]|nr:diacylglycerol kinase family lipid kinase [Bacteroidales bacterium]